MKIVSYKEKYFIIIIIFLSTVFTFSLNLKSETVKKNKSTLLKVASPSAEKKIKVDVSKHTKDNTKYSSELVRMRALGDRALQDNFPNIALDYYKKYRDLGVRNQNAPAIKDAYECIISVLLLTEKPELAEKELRKFEKRYSTMQHIRTSLYRADILILRKKYTEAKRLLEKTLKELSIRNNFYFHALSGLGYVYVKLHDWKNALRVYDHLQVSGSGTDWYKKALKWKIYALLMAGKIKEAELIVNSIDPKEFSSPYTLKLLKILLFSSQNKIKEALEVYKTIEKEDFSSVNTTDELLFLSLAQLGKILLTQKDYPHAVSCLTNAMFYSPDAESGEKILMLLIDVYAKYGKINEAIEAARRYLLYYPRAQNRDTVNLKLAGLLKTSGRDEQALKIYRELMGGAKDLKIQVNAAMQAYSIYFNHNDFDQALECLNFFISHVPHQEQKAVAEYKKALILMKKQQFTEAYVLFRKIAEHFSNMRENSLLNAVKAAYKAEMYEKVIETADIFLKQYPTGKDYKSVIILQAYAYKKVGKFTTAKELFDSFVKNYPNNPFSLHALYETAIIAFDQCEFDTANNLFSAFIKKYPKSELIPEILYKRIYASYFEGKEDSALHDCDILIKNYPDSQFTIYALFWAADYFREIRQFDKAYQYLSKIVSLSKNNENITARALYESAYVFFIAGKYDNALPILKKLTEDISSDLKSKDENKHPPASNETVRNTSLKWETPQETAEDIEIIKAKAFFLTGDIYTNKTNYSKAVTCFKNVLRFSSDVQLQRAAKGRIADCYFSMYHKDMHNNSLLDKAIKLYKEILTDNTTTPGERSQTLYKLAKTFEISGNIKKAFEYYDKLIVNYEVDIVDKYVETIWLTKGILAAINLCKQINTPASGRKAIKYYKFLVKYTDFPLEEYKRRVREIRKKFRRL